MKKKPRFADGIIDIVSDSEGSDFLVIFVPIDDELASEEEDEVNH